MPLDENILGMGVYTPREAARLVGTNAQQVLRWTRGSGPNEPLWPAHYQFLDEDVSEISFYDLIEIRVVSAMRKAGIALQSIRFAISYAKSELKIERPLASRSFKIDGDELLMDAIENDGEYVSLSKKRAGQKVFKQIISQSLNDLEYDGSYASRWRPRGFSKVIIDPQRHFGDPILDKHGISTSVLKREFENFGDVSYLSKIYEITASDIRSGVGFEDSLDRADGQGTSGS
ncbi:hypothetical protein [Tateyamaria sp.]|uniref:hypothetical protein n=1 Tax=Tateyamaria sp. TaxID=1929288 RepID=UPI00329E07AA